MRRFVCVGLILLGVFVGGAVFQKTVGLGRVFNYRIFRLPVPGISPMHQGRLKIFILAGQSNMEGHGNLSEWEPPAPALGARLYVFRNYRWEEAREPLGNRGVGPGLAFGEELVRRDPDTVIGLVMVARGGTNIAQWQPSHDPESLYAKMIQAARAASYEGEIAGMIFFQGENDAEGDATDHPHDWAEYFSAMVGRLRQDLQKPGLPVVFAQIGGNGGMVDVVQAQQQAVALDHCSMIVTKDLPFSSAPPHYATKEYREIGRRFAQSYLGAAAAGRGKIDIYK